MRKFWVWLGLLGVLSLSGCSSMFCDPRFQHCGSDPKMQDEISEEVGEML